MRPVQLSLQAFGPYPNHTVIDFRDAVSTGLFGIYGQTGSGKSTLFSAMTFALFGVPAKPEQEAPSLRSDHAAPGLQTEVEFIFDLGGKRYLVQRRPDQLRPKTRGTGETRSSHEAYLFDATGLSLDEINSGKCGKIIAEKKVREVDAAITGILGYSVEQFRQIVLLPQGRFESFLTAKTRERLQILRELFDVSLFEALMAKFKTQADQAEQQVREERAIYKRRLLAEGFEDHEDLANHLTAEILHLSDLEQREKAALAKSGIATKELQKAERTAELFAQAAKNKTLFSGIDKRKAQIEVLSEGVQKAEQASPILDAEQRLREAHIDLEAARDALVKAAECATQAQDATQLADENLKKEEARSEEGETLRRNLEDLTRFEKLLATSAAGEEAAETARKIQQQAKQKLDEAEHQHATLSAARGAKAEALKLARMRMEQRQQIVIRLTALAAKQKTAEAYERAEEEIRTAQETAAQLQQDYEHSSQEAASARQDLVIAEQKLSGEQALHLAQHLEDGAPCPVCGAVEHPEPAAGTMETADLDAQVQQAHLHHERTRLKFQNIKDELTRLEATLADRKKRLASMELPPESAAACVAKTAIEQSALKELGAEANIADVEAELEAFEAKLVPSQHGLEALRRQYETNSSQAAEAIGTLAGMLSEIPPELRHTSVLAARSRAAAQELQALLKARSEAEVAARQLREDAIKSEKDRESAEKLLAASQDRIQSATHDFQTRLSAAGLTEQALADLKPAMSTLAADKKTITAFWQDHKSAQDAAEKSAQAVAGLTQPDLAELREILAASLDLSRQNTEDRVSSQGRIAQLKKLTTDLQETIQKIEEFETATGSLRELSALLNGQNEQRLTLETYAIGAMFDQVLEAANLRLGPMTSGRYRLDREIGGSGRGSRGLGIQVFDFHTGKSRAANTLSGGESFIAALALALGLADTVESSSGKVRLDTIFIDEGFGSLDTENGSGTLDQVLQVLNALVSQNRSVGLISHVPLVQEMIPGGFHVRKGLGGSWVEKKDPL